MECRLCLCSAPPDSLVPIYDDAHSSSLVQSIKTCCQLQVKKDDKLPNMICLSCVNKLESLSKFRNACLKSDKSASPMNL